MFHEGSTPAVARLIISEGTRGLRDGTPSDPLECAGLGVTDPLLRGLPAGTSAADDVRLVSSPPSAIAQWRLQSRPLQHIRSLLRLCHLSLSTHKHHQFLDLALLFHLQNPPQATVTGILGQGLLIGRAAAAEGRQKLLFGCSPQDAWTVLGAPEGRADANDAMLIHAAGRGRGQARAPLQARAALPFLANDRGELSGERARNVWPPVPQALLPPAAAAASTQISFIRVLFLIPRSRLGTIS